MRDEDTKSFPLRISQQLFDELRAWAGQELRSVNGQIEYILREAVSKRKRTFQKQTQGNNSLDEPNREA